MYVCVCMRACVYVCVCVCVAYRAATSEPAKKKKRAHFSKMCYPTWLVKARLARVWVIFQQAT